jgi:hypothetical protein
MLFFPAPYKSERSGKQLVWEGVRKKSGGYVALILALQPLINAGALPPDVLKTPVATISVDMIQGQPILDLFYAEDS